MSTWHQQQAPVRLWHETLWTVVFDKLGGMTSVERFKDPVDAQRACYRHTHAGERSYVLPPQRST
jgi:hypothetical protein